MTRKTLFLQLMLMLMVAVVSACGTTGAERNAPEQDTVADYNLAEPAETTNEEIDLSIEGVEEATEEPAEAVVEKTEMVDEATEAAMAEEDSTMEEETVGEEAMDKAEPNPTDEVMAEETVADEAMNEEDKAEESAMADEAMMEEDKAEEVAVTDEAMAGETMSGPDWFSAALVDVNSGETFTISDFKGKVVLVETMAVWCPLCTRQQGHIQALRQSLGERDDLISLSLDIDPNENADILKAHADKNSFTWRYAVAPPEVAREIGQLYGGQFLNPPATPMFIIDRQGEVHPLPFGDKAPDVLQEALQPFLSEG